MGTLTESQMVASMFGGSFMVEILRMGRWVVGLFSLIFLFYTNSFLLKRRKKEFGLYHILGLEKRHVALLLVLELFYTVLTGLALGILTGTLLIRQSFFCSAGSFMNRWPWGLIFL
ncbi:MAG: FtsX-like permease family protein [Blautia sp.]